MDHSTTKNGTTSSDQPAGAGFTSGGEGFDGTVCTGCGAIGYSTDKYCACCGKPLARTCGACKAHILQPIAHYCTQCGASLG
jgi:hypothetical protein